MVDGAAARAIESFDDMGRRNVRDAAPWRDADAFRGACGRDPGKPWRERARGARLEVRARSKRRGRAISRRGGSETRAGKTTSDDQHCSSPGAVKTRKSRSRSTSLTRTTMVARRPEASRKRGYTNDELQECVDMVLKENMTQAKARRDER